MMVALYSAKKGASISSILMILQLSNQAIEQGARLVSGGKALADKKGFYIEPTVFADVSPNSVALMVKQMRQEQGNGRYQRQ